ARGPRQRHTRNSSETSPPAPCQYPVSACSECGSLLRRGHRSSFPRGRETRNRMSTRRYKFDFRDKLSRLRAKGAIPGKAVNVKVRVANDPDSPSIPAFGELDEEGIFEVTFTNLSGEHRVIRMSFASLLWEIHCR